MYILVFKTNIKTRRDLETVHKALALHQQISRWTVDRQDIDKVLRIESSANNPNDIIHSVRNAGYLCAELD